MSGKRLLIGWVLLTTLMLLPGCATDPSAGYTTAQQFPEGIDSVCVPIWNRAKPVYRRGWEDRLTEALVKRIELDTPYEVTTKARADTELTGSIDRISQRVLSFNPDTGRARELEVTFTTSFRWTDLRSGEVILERNNFRIAGTYIEECGFSEDFFQGGEDVVNELAKRIVEQMESPW